MKTRNRMVALLLTGILTISSSYGYSFLPVNAEGEVSAEEAEKINTETQDDFDEDTAQENAELETVSAEDGIEQDVEPEEEPEKEEDVKEEPQADDLVVEEDQEFEAGESDPDSSSPQKEQLSEVELVEEKTFDIVEEDTVDVLSEEPVDETSDEAEENTNIIAQGNCCDNVHWTLDEEGTFIISGTGDYVWRETDYYPSSSYSVNSDWEYRDDVKTAIIKNGVTNVARGTFTECMNLEKVILEDSVSKIETNAFFDCKKLKDVEFSSELNEIGDSAFYGTSISELVIPNSVTLLNGSVFKNCKSLKKIQLPDRLQSQSDLGGTFYNCILLEEIDIPDGVPEIGKYCFYNCSSLKSVELPNDLKNIEMQAFQNCVNLGGISIPSTTKYIGNGAFAGCTNLKNVVINEGLDYIDSGAFSGCDSLETFSIPSSVAFIGKGILSGCVNLKRIEVDLANEYFCSDENVLYSKDKTQLLSYAQGKDEEVFVFPENVKAVGANAFRGSSKLHSVSLSNELEEIEEGAFSDCQLLESVEIPSTVEVIGSQSFARCLSLAKLVIREGVKKIDSYAFTGCPINELHIPLSLHTICKNNFDTNGTIESVYYSGKETNYKKIVIEEENWKLRNSTIQYSTGIVDGGDVNGDGNITWSLDTDGILSIKGTGELGDFEESNIPWKEDTDQILTVIIEDGVTEIGKNSFLSCESLTKVYLPEGLNEIKNKAFWGCKNLKRIICFGGEFTIEESTGEESISDSSELKFYYLKKNESRWNINERKWNGFDVGCYDDLKPQELVIDQPEVTVKGLYEEASEVKINAVSVSGENINDLVEFELEYPEEYHREWKEISSPYYVGFKDKVDSLFVSQIAYENTFHVIAKSKEEFFNGYYVTGELKVKRAESVIHGQGVGTKCQVTGGDDDPIEFGIWGVDQFGERVPLESLKLGRNYPGLR